MRTRRRQVHSETVWLRPTHSRFTLNCGLTEYDAGTARPVESRIGAVAWAIWQRSVSHPRSSNRTCGFPASGAAQQCDELAPSHSIGLEVDHSASQKTIGDRL